MKAYVVTKQYLYPDGKPIPGALDLRLFETEKEAREFMSREAGYEDRRTWATWVHDPKKNIHWTFHALDSTKGWWFQDLWANTKMIANRP